MTKDEQLLFAAKCALADLEGLLQDVDDDTHPGWDTIEDLHAAIERVETFMTFCDKTRF